MGNSRSQDIAAERQQPVKKIEIVFSSETIGSPINRESGSRKSLVTVNHSLQQATLFITSSRGKLPVSSEQPVEAVRLLLCVLRRIPGTVEKDWTTKKFIPCIAFVEVIEQTSIVRSSDKGINATRPERYIRIHFQGEGDKIQKLLDLIKKFMREEPTMTISSLKYDSMDDFSVNLGANFTPSSSLTITTEAQLDEALGFKKSQDISPLSVASATLGKLAGASELFLNLQKLSGLSQKTEGTPSTEDSDNPQAYEEKADLYDKALPLLGLLKAALESSGATNKSSGNLK